MTNEFAPKCLVGLYLTHGKSGEKASHDCYNVVSILKCFIVWVKVYIINMKMLMFPSVSPQSIFYGPAV